MPELPEVESTRRSLLPHVVGGTVARVELHRAEIITSRLPATNRTGFARLWTDRQITTIERHGKDLALGFTAGADTFYTVVHLGMSGSLRYVGGDPEAPLLKHTHIVWRLRSGGSLRLHDPRRFGGLWLYPSMEAIASDRWCDRGPDALAITPRALHARLQRTQRPLKAALLDQSIVAGLGNIYVDELLHRCGHHPQAAADGIALSDVQRLVRAMRRLLQEAITAGGSTIRDYVDGRGAAGAYQLRHHVYGRGGEPCRRCRSVLATGRVGGRTTVWCDTCQAQH